MQIVAGVAYIALLLYSIVLVARLVLEWIRSYSRDFRPRGIMLLLFELIYTLTDPPMRLLRSAIPPLRIGAIALDLSLPILLLACWILMRVALAPAH